MTMTRKIGRARDASIDARILAVARRHLSAYGYERMSLAAVAEEAGTSRPALYRRWPGKAELAAAAVATLEEPGQDAPTGDPFADLVAELADFQNAVSRPGRMSLVGTMLQDTTTPDVLARYRARVIAPRRRRLHAILDTARRRGLIDADADLEVAVTLCTGNWYARALAHDQPPEHWPQRTAALVWRAVGGQHPADADGGVAPEARKAQKLI
ncbi:TetR/AcrR family transcriptional regulator [Nonomuraea guangzhouensis]|uniref:TetR/AcrR family transcriptional regulator n=1 Tax=Nonomuraea guangzhouensis TaxID=1291555 RepID=A0ABW4G1N7_9ACTN|nr:TetR/AcrR family transcriptional regulator [Nonomuraea guangzhouensis]